MTAKTKPLPPFPQCALPPHAMQEGSPELKTPAPTPAAQSYNPPNSPQVTLQSVATEDSSTDTILELSSNYGRSYYLAPPYITPPLSVRFGPDAQSALRAQAGTPAAALAGGTSDHGTGSTCDVDNEGGRGCDAGGGDDGDDEFGPERLIERLLHADSAGSGGAIGSGLGVKLLPITYALSLLSQLLPIPLHVFDGDGHYLKKLDNDADDNWNVLQTDLVYRKSLIAETQSAHLTLFTKERPVLLGGVALADNLILIVGPVVTTPVDSNFTQLFAAKHQASNVVLQVCTPAKLASMLLLINAALTGEKISLTSFLDRYFFQDDTLQQTMSTAAEIFYHETVLSRPHNPISFERDIIEAVKKGDLEALDRALNSPFASMRGILAAERLRSQKNLAIVDITLASRALIDTGFSAEEAFILSDAFIRSVEDSKDCEEVAALARACAVRCAQLVQQQNEKAKHKNTIKSPLVQQACDYIDRHAFAKLDVKAIAEHLKVSVGYLSKLFKREQHITMSDYMRKRKIELATMMLANTEQSIDEIALSLSFCSQSHFGAVFSREMGCTPANYRKKIRLQSGNLQMA